MSQVDTTVHVMDFAYEESLDWRQWRNHLLQVVDKVCPSLTALDLGYSHACLELTDLQVLCQNKTMKLVDLSQCMKYMDFRPGLEIFCQHAPQLQALAIHGLLLDDPTVLRFGTSCKQLAVVQFMNCRGLTASGIAAFMAVAKNLKEIRVNGSDYETYLQAFGYYEIDSVLEQHASIDSSCADEASPASVLGATEVGIPVPLLTRVGIPRSTTGSQMVPHHPGRSAADARQLRFRRAKRDHLLNGAQGANGNSTWLPY
jgi:hypothetical protein